MKTYPLESITLDQARDFQFRMVDAITKTFTGTESLTRGDLGVVPGLNKPRTTLKAEQAIARFFDAEAAILVRGSGTGAIRYALFSTVKPGGSCSCTPPRSTARRRRPCACSASCQSRPTSTIQRKSSASCRKIPTSRRPLSSTRARCRKIATT
ncbi:hypothetical protein [uncultured Dubosiella sp.]|uniref:hypothetical protein n=1 Tax=uncultured Dubosiella sp. TaxID=1937011 RepID=UPI0025B47558|nr:hypothetical protein [uncultured Dubosiella sp.]